MFTFFFSGDVLSNKTKMSLKCQIVASFIHKMTIFSNIRHIMMMKENPGNTVKSWGKSSSHFLFLKFLVSMVSCFWPKSGLQCVNNIKVASGPVQLYPIRDGPFDIQGGGWDFSS